MIRNEVKDEIFPVLTTFNSAPHRLLSALKTLLLQDANKIWKLETESSIYAVDTVWIRHYLRRDERERVAELELVAVNEIP